jgi:hypothetical protein
LTITDARVIVAARSWNKTWSCIVKVGSIRLLNDCQYKTAPPRKLRIANGTFVGKECKMLGDCKHGDDEEEKQEKRNGNAFWVK